MTVALNFIGFISLLWGLCNCANFDDQPKLLTENGNFVIESAKDRNISFRLKGNSYLNMNGMNFMNFLAIGNQSAAFNVEQMPNWNLGLRLSALEEQFRQIPSLDDESSTDRNQKRTVWQRVTALERKINRNSGTNTSLANLNRRIERLEIDMNQLEMRLNADNCSSNPCLNGGTCTNTFGGYVCVCPDAWTGTSCDEDVNECSNFAGTDLGCQNSVSCENTPGGYICRCKPGWLGIHCTKRTVDCSQSSSYELCGHGICVHTNDPNSYKCICDQGWTSNGTSPACTIDIDECSSALPHCSRDPEVQCINTPGSYACGECPHGFTGNGFYCKDVDECLTNNGGCSLSPMVQCINTRGSSKCGPCPFGYTGDGKFCLRISGEQSGCREGVCHPLATCTENQFGVSCTCPPQFSGSGIGPFGCVPSTLAPNICASNPCLNGGTCENVGSFGYRCECPAGTVPPRCATASGACSSNPCRNGGTCIPVGQHLYRCTCTPKKTGRNCQLDVRACGGVLNSLNGTLKYPAMDTYPHNSRCAWLIKTDVDKVLNVTFTKFELELSMECRYDWLQIHDGRSSDSYMIGRFCGNELPRGGNILTTRNMMYLWFRSDNSSAHEGFELKWTSVDPVCGGEIEIKSHGIISTPGSPGTYPPNRDCIWKLTAPMNKRIHLHFFTLQLEAHENCEFDYLSIHNGPSIESDLMEKFCNTSHPAPLISPANELTLHFHSDADGTDSGFQIHYSLIEGIQGCGGTFTASSGEFGSPIQDGKYPNNIECHYLIKAPRNSQGSIKITFLQFQLEDGSCAFDYVSIYEGSNEDGEKVGKWCGKRMPPEYTSQSNEILVVFRTDSSYGYGGFRLKYETLCGGKFGDENGVITSPRFPNSYEDNKNCAYDIEAPLGKAIILNFTDFSIESDCDFDSLKIYDGVNANGTKIGEYCGDDLPPPAISTLNHMHLIFSTDYSNTGPGFRATYSFIDAECGGILKNPGVNISPPSGDSGYSHQGSCKWIIVAPPGHIIELTVKSFELEQTYECFADYLAIYDGIVVNETGSVHPIGKYCGTVKPPVMMSSSSAMSLFFRSDESVNAEGFVVTYAFIDGRNLCGGQFHSLEGTITSPRFPEDYPTNQDCTFVIHAPQGKQITLNVEEFDLERSETCGNYDTLEIRNGGNDRSPLIGAFCGTQIPRTIKSISNQIYLRFKSDQDSGHKGFKISYDTASSGCGGIFTGSLRGTLTSPNYPEPYPGNMQCDYTVHVSRGSTVLIQLTDIGMEVSSDCSYDYVSFYDGPNSASKLLGHYCNVEQIVQIESTSNVMFVRFVSDFNNNGRGFEAKFSANCNREIHDLRGAIESPNYPSKYPNLAKCEWKITPLPGNRLYFEFSDFDLEHIIDYEYDDDLVTNEPACTDFDFLTIEERDKDVGTMIRSNKYCDHMPNKMNSSNTVVIKFQSDFSNAGRGFHLEYEIQGCGGILRKPEGSFSSPNYPSQYPQNTRCQWIIEVEYGHLVQINFTDFDFESSEQCNLDGLIISNDREGEKIISKICGVKHDTNPSIVTSFENRVYVSFFSDISFSGRGFTAKYQAIPAKCGGTFTLIEGSIFSPNYPKNYDPGTYCQWLIRTEPSHSIYLKFTDFVLENDCQTDTVQVYDGHDKSNDKLLLKSCGTQTIDPNATNITSRPGFTMPLTSTGNEMLIVMEADHGVQAKGFAAKYATSCGSKIVTSSSGTLKIGHNLRWTLGDCVWVITASDPNQHVSLSITHIENEPSMQRIIAQMQNATETKCTAKISIHDGTSMNASKVAEICSSTHPPTITSEGNSLTIAITVERDFSFMFDITAYYTVIDNECGGEFKALSGQIASPGYPKKSYMNNIECEWTISASPGNEMTISILTLDIDETDHCNGDYLEIRESNSAGKLIGVYCGKTIPPTLRQTNKFWLKFRSDNDGVGLGFLLEYSYVKLIEQTGTSGTVTSMLYPEYITNTIGTYKWRITVQPGFLIHLTPINCILKRDSLILIYDGYDSTSALLTTIRTDFIPTEPILSTSNVVLIEFEIPIFSESKFQIDWNEVPRTADIAKNLTNSSSCPSNSITTVNDSIILESPGFPNGYAEDLDCVWTFLPAKMGYHVGIRFVTIDLEVTSNCMADFVRVGTGSDLQNFDQKPKLCAINHDSPINTRFKGTPNLRVRFVSDISANRTGFNAMVMLECGGVLEGPNGRITTDMTMNQTCTWRVNVDRGRTIQFEFDSLHLPKNDDGSCRNYILIRNGIHDDSPFLGAGKYCDGSPTIPSTSSNKATVQFYNNGLPLQSNRFILKYQQVEHNCGGLHLLDYANDSMIITSPNYPNIPSPHIECTWRITAPNGELLKIEFLERFDLTSIADCTLEYVEIREGTTLTAPMVGKYCHEKPQPIFTESNMIRITYFTDVSIPRNGFKLKVSFARCGQSITANEGYVSSPGYPAKGAYPTAATCDYHINARSGSSLNITILDIDLPEAVNCSEVDHIIFYSVIRQPSGIATYREIHKFCGFAKHQSFDAYGPNILVRFVTKSSTSEYRGFRFQFKSVEDNCDKTIIASSGMIETDDGNVEKDEIKFCIWSITVPKGHRIKFDVLDFDFGPSPYDGMESRILFFEGVSDYTTIFSELVASNIDKTKPIYSSDNEVTVSSFTFPQPGHRGLKIRFSSDEPTVCDGNLNELTGTLTTPIDSNYTQYNCAYSRSRPFFDAQPNVGTLSVKIVQEFRSNNMTTCIPNLVTEIAVKYTSQDDTIAFKTKCPPKYETIVTPHVTTKIILKQSAYYKFSLPYKVHNCGGILTEESTQITIPILPSNYGELDCAWQYTTNTDQNIQLMVNSRAMNCETEYLNIYRGMSSNRPHAAKICGGSPTSNRPIIINGQNAFVVYHSDNYIPLPSPLQIQVVTSDGICGGIIDAPNYIFSSPKNGTKYPANTECEWIIRAQNGYHIGLTFINRFMIEQSPTCDKDYLKIFDKVDGEFREIKKLCGREFPPFVNSTGKEMKVLFRTDADGNGDGFTIEWNENCGGIFKATNIPQYITSPRYPANYPGNAFCNYTIIADKSQHITVKFSDLDLEAAPECNYDNVTIYKRLPYSRYRMRPVGTYCTNSSAPTYRSRDRIDVVFRSDPLDERTGFKFMYGTDQCGGNITESTKIGSILEDGRKEYFASTTCVWFITAPPDRKIAIRFEEFELEYAIKCFSDYVDVFSGHHMIDSLRRARLCGNLTQHVPVINIDSNTATVKFATDPTIQGKGFTALILFSKNCNEYINLTGSNPRYILDNLSNQYESLLNCEYIVSVPKGYVIQAKFNQMHLQPCTTTNVTNLCTCDYLTIRDGAGPFAESFGTFCGHKNPPDMQTTAGSLYVNFVTDNVDSSTGFSIALEMIESPCGRNSYYLNESMSFVTIQLPMHGELYQPNLNCLWKFSTHEDDLIEIIFERFDLEEDPSNKCTADFLEIADENTKSYISEGLGQDTIFSGSPSSQKQYFFWGRQWPNAAHRYCGSGKPIDYISTHDSIHVHFKSNERYEKSGFTFTARTFAACARNFTALQGHFLTKLSSCEQYIHVPENYTISLYLVLADFFVGEECSEEKSVLKVYDANSNTLIKYYCDDTIPLFTTTNFIRLKFQNGTAGYYGKALYDITYLASDKGPGCGGEFYSYGGMFTSPGYPNTDRNNSDCTWTINVPINLLVAIQFQEFDMGSSARCDVNYVEVIEKDPSIASTKFCGKDEPAPYKAKSNQLKIHFKSSTRFGGNGFIINFMSVHESSSIDIF